MLDESGHRLNSSGRADAWPCLDKALEDLVTIGVMCNRLRETAELYRRGDEILLSCITSRRCVAPATPKKNRRTKNTPFSRQA
jgi:hypothetical protein